MRSAMGMFRAYPKNGTTLPQSGFFPAKQRNLRIYRQHTHHQSELNESAKLGGHAMVCKGI